MTVTDRISQLAEARSPWLTDGGLETDMVFNHGVDLPSFASFTMLEDAQKRQLLADYFTRYIEMAAEAGTGFVLDTCHAWAAGWDLATAVDDVRARTGRIDLVHLNNSRDPAGSSRDRHAPLAEGEIPTELLLDVARAAGCPVVLETPGDSPAHAEEIAMLRAAL